MLLMTYRGDEVQSGLVHFLAELDRHRSVTEVRLERLTMAEADVMIRAILDLRRPVRRDYLETVHGVTCGNPFFIEEVLKSSLPHSSGADPDSAGPDVSVVPRTVQEAVRQRTAVLSGQARRLLDLAAACGTRVNLDLLSELAHEEVAALLPWIRELIDAQLLAEEPEDRLAFRHALTRQAVYTKLLGVERRQLHRRIGEALETRRGRDAETLEMYAADLAHHFAEAEVWDKTLEYSVRAAEQAHRLSTPRAVIEHMRRALEAARRLSRPPLPRWLRLLANAQEVTGDFDGALATMQAALDAALLNGDEREQWEARIGLGVVWQPRNYTKTGEYWRAALQVAQTIGDERLLAHSLNRVGNWHLNVEQPEAAVSHHEEALRIFERLGDEGGVAETLDLLGMAWFVGGDMARSRAYYEQALPLFERLHDNQGYSSSLATMSVCCPVYHNDTLCPSVTQAEGTRWLEQARRVAVEIGWRAGEAYALLEFGLCLGPWGDYGRALECTLSAIAIDEEIRHLQWTSAALCTLGSIQLDLLDFEAAQRTLERAHATARETGSLHWTRVSAGFLAQCHLRQGGASSAAAVLDAVLPEDAPTRTLGQRTIGAARVELALVSGEPQRALALVDVLIATAPAGQGHMPARPAKLRADALALIEDASGAEAAYREAVQLARATGQRGLLWRCHAGLAHLYRKMGRRSRSLEERSLAHELIGRLAGTIPDAARREAFLNAAALDLPPQVSPRQAAKLAFGGLTEREREIAALVARGLSNAEIAAELVLSERTVETHITHILAKLNFASRSQVAAWAVETGLIARPGPSSQPR